MKYGVITFCGSKGSGKSTSANLFKDLFNGPTEELAFAGHLKNTCSKVFDLDMKHFLDPSLKEAELDDYIVLNRQNIEDIFKGFEVSFDYDKHVRPHIGQVFDTPRLALQYVGTEVLHPIDALIHVKATMKNKSPDKLSIITDLRFVQEFNFLKERPDFLPVYVFNTNAENVASSDTHASEQQLKLFKDVCLKMDNNGDFGALINNLRKLIGEYYGS